MTVAKSPSGFKLVAKHVLFIQLFLLCFVLSDSSLYDSLASFLTTYSSSSKKNDDGSSGSDSQGATTTTTSTGKKIIVDTIPTTNTENDNNNIDKDESVMVSPVLNREIQTSVIAHDWPTSYQNIFCEAYAYFFPLEKDDENNDDDDDDDDNNNNNNRSSQSIDSKNETPPNQYLEKLIQIVLEKNPTISSYSEAIHFAIEASAVDEVDTISTTATASSSFSQQDQRLLEYSLILRANSPLCELHRGLARDAMVSLLSTTATTISRSSSTTGSSIEPHDEMIIAVIYPQGNVITSTSTTNEEGFVSKLLGLLLETTEAMSANNNNKTLADWLLPGEVPMSGYSTTSMTRNDNDDKEDHLLILYANLGTISFARTMQLLKAKKHELDMKINLVVRHLGNIYYEDEKKISSSLTTSMSTSSGSTTNSVVKSSSAMMLQGYGVRLDIRNVEYKVFDDRAMVGHGKVDHTDDGLMNLTTAYAEASKNNDGATETSSSLLAPSHGFLAGINLTAILSKLDYKKEQEIDNDDSSDTSAPTSSWEKMIELESELWKIHDAHQSHSQIIPPTWQRRRLPLQAATAIVSSKDPLIALQDISQNLPSIASTLVHVKVPSAIQKMATVVEEFQKGNSFRSGMLYLNGGPVNVDRPSFNLFELLNVIRKEQETLNKMKKSIGPFLKADTTTDDNNNNNKESSSNIGALRQVQKAWMMGESFLDHYGNDDLDAANDNSGSEDDDDGGPTVKNSRKESVYRIDVGHGWKKAIMYLNDVEKDIQYRQWSRSVRQALMNMQFGMPLSVRRNIFTILSVMDPLQNTFNIGFSLGMQLVQSSYAARVGVLIVNEDDVKKCAKWVTEQGSTEDDVPCPVPPILSDNKISLTDLKTIPATTHALHRIVAQSILDFANRPGAIVAYIEYLISSLGEHEGDLFTMYDLVALHGKMMQAMQIGSEEEGIESAFDAIRDNDTSDDDLALYGMALRFAVNKGLKSGMSFVNGRPLPSDTENSSDAVGQIFSEEQQLIAEMIMAGVIRDSTPKSVYGKILSGPRVFKKNHPLLAQGSDQGSMHILLDTNMNPNSFITSSSVPFFADANFVIDASLAFDTKEGLEYAFKLTSTMDTFPSSIEDSAAGSEGSTKIGLVYRIFPSTPSAASSAVCSFFANAALLGSEITSLLNSLMLKYNAAISEGAIPDLALILGDVLRTDAVSDDVRDKILSEQENCNELYSLTPAEARKAKNMILANGRVYVLDDGCTIEKDDIELLLSMEMRRAKGVTKLLQNHVTLSKPSHMEVISRVAAFLAIAESSSNTKRVYVKDIITKLQAQSDASDSPLSFSWNKEHNDEDDVKLEVAIFLDPVTEAAQRVSPILRVIRDQLQLPLDLVLAPPTEIDGDARIPITSYYRLVADPKALPDTSPPKAIFSNLPTNHVLTIRVDVPEPWNIQQTASIQDTDNLLCDIRYGCSDDANSRSESDISPRIHQQLHITNVEYGLKNLLIFGQCYDIKGSPPNGLQLTLSKKTSDLHAYLLKQNDVEITMDGSISAQDFIPSEHVRQVSDTLVMKNVGYWQLRANPGVWSLNIAENSKGSEIFEMITGSIKGGKIIENKHSSGASSSKTLFMKDFVNRGELLIVKRRPGFETTSLFHLESGKLSRGNVSSSDEVINVFSLATGHLYERFLKIMMLSVTKRTSSRVKFWLFENFLSPTFKSSAKAMAERIGCEVEYVTYKWPEWLRAQTEKQRIIWGYKILFLDVLFPLDVKKIIYVDADQVIRGDLKELWDMDLQGKPYGYTPFCTSRKSTLGYQFWRDGFWKNHLQGKPYHISALYVVDLELFRRTLVGDQLRSIYQQLSMDPNSLANLDQDLPNYAQHQVPIFSLPQEWLWCESWCSDETKSSAKTIDLCNNPEHKEPKVSMAKRIISGDLFPESWVELDAEVEGYEKDYLLSLAVGS